MRNKTGKVIFATILLLSFMLAWSQNVHAQTPTPPPTRESLTKEIQARAQSDVDNGKSMESTEGLDRLFGEQAKQVGMPLTEVLSIYEQEYKTVKAAEPWWKELLPNSGWIIGFIGILIALFRDKIAEVIKSVLSTLGTAIYNRFARFRILWGLALRKYRQSLENTYRELKIPFRAGRPLEMKDVYVPVRVDGGDKKQVDAYQTIQNQKRLVVLGDPGSGKTMFLRHVAFTYARQGLDDFDGQPVPVYLELNRVESAGGDLLAALTKTLENHNFPGAEGFLKSALENHALLILLDGLDEVNAAARPALVNQIRDFDQKHPANRMIVTCRKAVYQGELDAWVDGKLEIIEFSDQQIQRFMTSWQKDMPAEKSIEHFFRTLQERPQIMALARNPLLLTMVAYLYTDTEFALPHSRSEFYSRSTDLLLDQWKLERNRYKATHKRIVLQRLALFNQSQAGKTGERRTLELADVLKEIRAVLPDLTLKTEDAQPLLDEIVQRSGLMLAIDGGTRYQFTHLTLQEYFAARALEADQKGLLDFYRATPDAWREVVRLWCALEHDSTAMLKELHTLDPVMALECLSNAQQVDNAYADELIRIFQPRLYEAFSNDLLTSAFAMLAADPRPRGKKWFEFTKNNLNDEGNRLAACAVLARTNIPQAAEPLAKLAANKPDVIPFLVQLGNLAVPSLTESARKGEIWAMDALVDIGTPQATLAALRSLQPLLWVDDLHAYHAAWRLAAILPMLNTENALKADIVSPEQRKTKQIEWVWEPFSDNINFRVIVGRISYLLHTTPANYLPQKDLPCDSRLVIPLCIISSQDGQLQEIDYAKRKEFLRKTNQSNFIATYTHQVSSHPVWLHLFRSLSSALQSMVLSSLLQTEATPNVEDWRNLFRPLRFTFESSLQVLGVKILAAILGLLNIWGLINGARQNSFMENIRPFLAGVIVAVVIFLVERKRINLLELCLALCLLFLGIIPALGISMWILSQNWFFCISIILVSLAGSTIIAHLCNGIVPDDIVKSDKPENLLRQFISAARTILIVYIIVILNDRRNSEAFVNTFVLFGLGSLLISLLLSIIKNGLNSVVGILNGSYKIRIVNAVFTAIGGFIFLGAIDGLFLYLPTNVLYDTWGGIGVILFWAIYLTCLIFLIWSGKHQQRRSQNPMHKFIPHMSR